MGPDLLMERLQRAVAPDYRVVRKLGVVLYEAASGRRSPRARTSGGQRPWRFVAP